jgi:quinol monooxygenase YgiN
MDKKKRSLSKLGFSGPIGVESRPLWRSAKQRTARPRKSRRASAGSGKPQSATANKLPKEAVTLIVQLRPREGQDMLLEAELRALVGPTRKEDGCLTYDLHRSADAPSAFLLHEIWASREAHTRHTNTPHFLRWNARKDALLAAREVTFWKQVL